MGIRSIGRVIERLTSAQKNRLRRAFREAFGELDQARAINAMYAKYLDLYGVSLNTLQAIIEEDQRGHEAEYRALQAIRESRAEGSRRDRNKKNAWDKKRSAASAR